MDSRYPKNESLSPRCANRHAQEENKELNVRKEPTVIGEEISAEEKKKPGPPETRYRTIFENSFLGNKILDSDLKILKVNQTLLNMMQFDSEEELVGRKILEFAHPDYVEDWLLLQTKLWSKQMPSFTLETCLKRKDGSFFWCRVISILFEDNGSMMGYTVLEDIGSRKIASEILAESERRFRMLTNSMPQQVWTAGPDGHLTFVNKQVAEYFGKLPEEVTGAGWQQFVHPEDLLRCLQDWQQALQTGGDYKVEFRLRMFDGTYRWHLCRAIPVIEQETVESWIGTNTDIHDQKVTEMKKDEFLSIASHELKTPLANIKAYNQLMERRLSPEMLKTFISKSAAHINRLQDLIRDLLDVTKINAGRLAYNFSEFNFDEVIKESVENVRLMADKHRIIIERSDSISYKGDKFRIEQVVVNFLTNAVKYSPSADRVIVNSKVEQDSIVVSVQDFGIGIAEADRAHLFERFYRSAETLYTVEGLGLGLYISSEILKRHDGSFWIESEKGRGTTFYFKLPSKSGDIQ